MSKFLFITTLILFSIAYAEILPLNYNFDAFSLDQTLALQKLNLTLATNGNPCGLKSYCGDALPFKTDDELKAFTDKNCHPLYRLLPLELKTSAQASTDFSGTNNQYANVDEADVLKTDGQYIYTVSGKTLSIVKVYPYPSVNITSTIKFDFAPSSIFLEGDYLAVFGTGYEALDYSYYGGSSGITSKMAYFYFRPQFTWVKVYNICDRSNPKLVKNYNFEGYYFDGRKTTNGYVYLLSSLSCNGRENPNPWYDFGLGKKTLKSQQIFYYPGNDYQSANFINIFAFNLKNPLQCD